MPVLLKKSSTGIAKDGFIDYHFRISRELGISTQTVLLVRQVEITTLSAYVTLQLVYNECV